jgi:hypothetical protein
MNFNVKYIKTHDINNNEYHLFDINICHDDTNILINVSFRCYNLYEITNFIENYKSTIPKNLKTNCFYIKDNTLYITSSSSFVISDIGIKGTRNINNFFKEITKSILIKN